MSHLKLNLLFLLFLSFFGIQCIDGDELEEQNETINYAVDNVYPSNCIDLEDGIYEMQLINDDDYPSVLIRCSNGYNILDYNLDSNLKSYFSSWAYWHRATVGPTMDELANWRQWYLADGNQLPHDYLVSPDCQSCEYVSNRQLYKEQTTYWMTGTFFGCYWRVKANSNCDMDYGSGECYTCLTDDRYINDITGDSTAMITDDSSETQYAYTGLCTHNVRRATHEMAESQEDCTTSRTDLVQGSQNLKPSLGTEGEYCVCSKPRSTHYTEYYTIKHNEEEEEDGLDIEDEEDMIVVENIENEEIPDDRVNIVELYQRDFEMGTYRIVKGGYYKVMEDIIFDFNPSFDDVNEPYAYWPMLSQAEEYPGAQDYRDEYSMGFFAGITIECDYVTLDLNGHTLAMSNYFYLQQSWFTIIELSQQYFLPGQSFGFFGSNPHFSTNVEISNGVLGLSSHHGIHGNSNSEILIKDLQIRDFNTHGIQLNGFRDIIIDNVEIGPSSDMSYFRGQWGIARVLLRRWQHIADETMGSTIVFKNREVQRVSMQDIVDDLKETMQYGWDFVTDTYNIPDSRQTQMEGTHPNNEKEEGIPGGMDQDGSGFGKVEFGDNWVDDETSESARLLFEAKKLFLNPTGIPSAASIYGIFLNKYGASVFTYNLYSKEFSSSATLQSITIHGLRHSMQEWPYLIATTLNDADGAGVATDEIKNPFFGPISATDLFNEFPGFQEGYPSYKGNIITDGYIASTKFMQRNLHSFKYLGQQCILSDVMVNWASMLDSEVAGMLGLNDEEVDVVYSDDSIDAEDTIGNEMQIGCNMDTMNHAGKGLLGIRIDSVDTVLFKDITIFDNHDSTPLGTNACGDYDETFTNIDGFQVKKTGHFRQTKPMQVGFSGNMNQGIAISASKNVRFEGDIKIFDLTSETGAVYGIAIWPNVDVFVDGNIKVDNLESGGNIGLNKFSYDDLPNNAPEVCALRLYEHYGDFVSSLNASDTSTVTLSCLAGDYGCLGESDQFSVQNLAISSNVINHAGCEFRFENSDTRIGMISKKKSKVEENDIDIEDGGEDKDNVIVVNVNENDSEMEENSLFGFNLLYNNSGHTNVITDVIWVIVGVVILLCMGYLMYKFCCQPAVRTSHEYRASYIRSRNDSVEFKVNMENDSNTHNSSHLPNYTSSTLPDSDRYGNSINTKNDTTNVRSEYVSL